MLFTHGNGIVPVLHAAREAHDHYRRAIENLKTGDWSGFGKELDALRLLLEQMYI